MKNKLFALLAAPMFQPAWNLIHRVSIVGMGFMNADSRSNGERRYLQQWARTFASNHSFPPVVVDVGANEGDFTAGVLELFPDATIHCFEPNPKTFSRLASRFKSNSRVILNMCGVGDVEGCFELHDYDQSDGSGHASFYKQTFEDIYPSNSTSHSAKIITLDSYAALHRIVKLDYVKVDVEGFERNVFEGMKDLFGSEKVARVQFEFNMHNAISGLTLYGISKIMKNFVIQRILPFHNESVISPDLKYNGRLEIFKYANYVAVSRGEI